MGVHNQNKQVCLQVIKKLLLNRILLNPVYYYAYSLAFPKVPSQKLVNVLNKIRVMFYASKVPSQYKSINEIYEDRIGNFVSHRKQKYNNKGIYILDKYLYNNYVHIHCDLNLKQENKEKRAISISDESYSLSFSFVKNSKVTTNKPKNVKENTVQNTMDDIKSPPKSPTYLGSPKGKTVKTEHTQLTNESHTHKKKT